MKRHHIRHRTCYRYAEPVRLGMHRLVLRPREGHHVTVLNHRLTLTPEGKFFWMHDVYGNHIALVEFPEPTKQLEIVNDVVIERMEVPEDKAPEKVTRASVAPMPPAYPDYESNVVNGYTHPVYEDDAPTVHAWALSQFQEQPPTLALDAVMVLTTSIHQQIRYTRREERGVQSPARTLALGSGSCRDMATLLMEACRTLGLAARFVSGYLDAMAAAAGRGSTHAWVDIYFPDTGWAGFDPTVGAPASHKHLALGVSAHPRGVMPISGIYEGPPGCYLGMEVSVSIQPAE